MEPEFELFRESIVAQMWREEGYKEARAREFEIGRAITIKEMVRRAAAMHAPSLDLGDDLEYITDLEALEDFFLAILEFEDVSLLRDRLKEMRRGVAPADKRQS